MSGYTLAVISTGAGYVASAVPLSPAINRYAYYCTPDAVIRYATYQGGNCTPCYPGSLSGNPVQ